MLYEAQLVVNVESTFLNPPLKQQVYNNVDKREYTYSIEQEVSSSSCSLE